MNAPDFSTETWICNSCSESFDVEVSSYDLNEGGYPKCPHCDSDNTEML